MESFLDLDLEPAQTRPNIVLHLLNVRGTFQREVSVGFKTSHTPLYSQVSNSLKSPQTLDFEHKLTNPHTIHQPWQIMMVTKVARRSWIKRRTDEVQWQSKTWVKWRRNPPGLRVQCTQAATMTSKATSRRLLVERTLAR
ncbi:hypothetical protein RHMOL_Rhmol02G0193000 [Rhododendron molle]|uniref:Uncharacterized protein n=1 Tax=Rhododendron molle TaxID=49168 RepID=A0ACC0PRM3_RHOML|nr:hypothetical protein RHMOL_Rhmol02G0193000 [Rhododendron molle]